TRFTTLSLHDALPIWLPHLYVHYDPPLRARSGGSAQERSVGARSAESRRAADRRSASQIGLGELRRGGPIADASWPHARGACALVRANAEARSRLRSRRDGRLAARRGPGLRVAARRARVGQSEPECAESLDGTLLRRNGDGRGHDLVRGPRHDAAARTLRRTGYRHTSIARRDAKALSFMDEGLHPAGVLVRADFPQARRQAVRGHPNTRRS